MKQPSVMAHQFSIAPQVGTERSSFDRSCGLKTAFPTAGELYPIYIDEALPGDTFSMNMTGFMRLATPLTPVMDNAFCNTFWFAVPYRLVWDNWQKFNGEQRDPGDSTDYLCPLVTTPVGGWAANSLADFFGLPVGVAGISQTAFFFRAYNLIWNEWFRDQNFQDSLTIHRGDGPDPATDYSLQRRGKRHDYFTSSLPWPQKGQSVPLPLGTSAPVSVLANGTSPPSFWINETGAGGLHQAWLAGSNTFGDVSNQWNIVGGPPPGGEGVASNPAYWDNPNLVGTADLSAATSATINQLRQAFAIQRLLEADARGGTRYTEILRAHFGVISPDARLQRPEFLGGGQNPINVVPVVQNSATDGSTPQGNLAAFGTSVMNGHGFTKSFTEHCLIIGLCSVRADLNYQQGLNRMWSRRRRYDYFWPELSHIGEQAVLSKEIYADGSADDEDVWGYQERFAEYRYKPSQITGEMRSSYPQSLDVWHWAQDFATRPLLNEDFIVDNPPIGRTIAVPSEPQFIADFYFKLRCARPMPLYGVPGLTRL